MLETVAGGDLRVRQPQCIGRIAGHQLTLSSSADDLCRSAPNLAAVTVHLESGLVAMKNLRQRTQKCLTAHAGPLVIDARTGDDNAGTLGCNGHDHATDFGFHRWGFARRGL